MHSFSNTKKNKIRDGKSKRVVVEGVPALPDILQGTWRVEIFEADDHDVMSVCSWPPVDADATPPPPPPPPAPTDAGECITAYE